MSRYYLFRLKGKQLFAVAALVSCLAFLHLVLSSEGIYSIVRIAQSQIPPSFRHLELSRAWKSRKDQEGHPLQTQPSKSMTTSKDHTSTHPKPTGQSIMPLKLTGEDKHALDSTNNEYIALCLAIKGQPLALVEWLVHHYQHQGISRFYIMDDGSVPPLSEIQLPATIPRSAVTFQYFNRTDPARVKYMQLVIYNKCMELHGGKHKWMGFIDADEFIEVKGKETLTSILQEIDKNDTIGALGINWEIHTSGGLLTRPPSARKAFTTCILDPDPNHSVKTGTFNEHIKSIVKTKSFKGVNNPHKMNLKNGAVTIGEHKDQIVSHAWRTPATRDRISVHHYAVKSRAEFEEKILRSNGMGDPKGWGHWEKIHHMPTRHCNNMALYSP